MVWMGGRDSNKRSWARKQPPLTGPQGKLGCQRQAQFQSGQQEEEDVLEGFEIRGLADNHEMQGHREQDLGLPREMAKNGTTD